jgi:mannose/fructose/N-acetylgalactosamine-specific phosphotransferase system component IIB
MIVLSRVDDRLIHGQVVEGWLRVVQARRIVVVSDQAAQDVFQAGLMRLAVPLDVEVTILPVAQAAKDLAASSWKEERVMLLMPSLKEARRLAEAGWSPSPLNLGGLHDAPGRTAYSPSLALSEEDIKDLLALVERKIAFDTRALPSDDNVPVETYFS